MRKKIFALFAAILASATLWASGLNIYAYGLKATQADNSVVIEYSLNEQATALTIALSSASGEEYSYSLADSYAISKGTHAVAIDLSDLPEGSYSWSIKAVADSTSFENALPDDDKYRYYLPQDVAVDVNPESPYFGRIYVSESTVGTADGASAITQNQQRGIFIYNPDLTFANGQTSADLGYDGNIGGDATARAGFKRLAIDAQGYVYVASRDADTKGVYRMDPANPSADFVQVLAASETVEALGIIGNDLYTLEGVGVGVGTLNRYSLTTIPAGDALASMNQYDILGFANTDCDAAADGRGGWWFVESRFNVDNYPCLVHINGRGVKDYEISSTSNSDMLFNDRASYRGVVAINVAGNLLAMGSNRRAVVFSIEYDWTTCVPTLTKLAETENIGNNIDGVAFDYADNLYIVSASTEVFCAYPMAKIVNECTTPAPAAYQIVVGNPPVNPEQPSGIEPVYIAFADTETDNDSGNSITTLEQIVKTGAEYFTSIYDVQKVYNARQGYGVKLGASSVVGQFKLSLTEPVTPDSIVIHGAAYNDTEGTLVFNGETINFAQYGKRVITPYTIVYDGNTSISEFEISNGTSSRVYIIDMAIYPHVEGSQQPEDSTIVANTLTFNVTVPAGTPSCYIAGTFNGWTFTEMTKLSATTYTYTLESEDAIDIETIEYKYVAGPNWAYVEKGFYGEELYNRTWSANDVVATWAAVPEQPADPEPLVFNVTVPEGTPNCYIIGSFNAWTFAEMTKISDTQYTYIYNIEEGVDVETIEYKYLAGPNWDYAEMSADGSDMFNRHWSESDTVAMWAAVPEPITLKTILEVLEAGAGQSVTTQGVINAVISKNVYMQDETGAMLVYLKQADTSLKMGDKITVSGTTKMYGGILELDQAEITSQETAEPMPEVETTLAALLENPLDYFAYRVFVEGVTISGYNSRSTYVSDGTNTAICYNVLADQSIFPEGTVVNLHLVAGFYNGFQFVGSVDGIVMPDSIITPIPEPADTAHLYLMGDITGWDPTVGTEMRKVERNVFEGTFEFTNDISYFGFVTELATEEMENLEDRWIFINQHRFGGIGNYYVDNGTVAMLYSGENLCYTIAPGTYKLRVDMNNFTLSVQAVDMTYNAEIFRVGDYINWYGMSSDYYTTFDAGTYLYSGNRYDVRIPFASEWHVTYANQPNGAHINYLLNQEVINARNGIQGNSNPADMNGSNPVNSFLPPASGSCLQIDARQDGKVLVFMKAATNKPYYVFENGSPMGYSLAMQTYPDGTMLGDNGLLSYVLTGDNVYNYLTADLLQETTGYSKIQTIETYANPDPSESGIEQGSYQQNGMAVMLFDAHANNTYLIGGGGSKIIVSGVAFLTGDTRGTQVIAQGNDGYADVAMMNVAAGKPSPIVYDTITVRLDPNTVDWTGAKVYVWTGESTPYYPAYGYGNATPILWAEAVPEDESGWWSASFVLREGMTYHVGWMDVNRYRDYPYDYWCVFNQTGSICMAYIDGQMQVVNCYSLLPDSTNTFTVHVPVAGTLGVELLKVINGWDNVLALNITGTLNETDMNILSRLTQCQVLDLSGTDITHFAGCRDMAKLREVVLPNTLTKIDDYAFYNCRRLRDINLSQVEEIGKYAFYNCIGLRQLSLPNLLTLGRNAFAEDESLAYQKGGLESISMPIVQTIAEEAFNGCYRLVNVEMPLATEIARYAFSRCYSLTQMDLSNVTTIGDEAFYMENGYDGNGAMLTHVILSDELTSIPYNCFHNCPIQEVNFPEALQRIESGAFNAAVIQNVVLPEGIVYVGSGNFDYAATVTIPSSIAEFYPFSSNWQTIYCYATDPNFNTTNYQYYTEVNSMTLYVPAVSLYAYQLHDNWYRFGQILPLEGDISRLDVRGPLYVNSLDGIADKANVVLHPMAELTMAAEDAFHIGNYVQYVGTRSEYKSKYEEYYDYNYGYYNSTTRYYYMTPYTGSMISNQVADADNVEIRLVPRKNEWTFFSLPYDVNMADITVEKVGTEPMKEVQWVIRYYSGANRAEGLSNTWLNVPADGVLQAHKGYILYWVNGESWNNQSDDNYYYFRLPSANTTRQNIFAAEDVNVPLTEYVSEYSQNRSWNLVGNPYPSFFNISEMDFSAPITTWNGYNYVAYSLQDDQYNLRPAEAFFVQAPEGVNAITFHKEGRNNTVKTELTQEEYNNREYNYYGYDYYYAPARREMASEVVARRIFNFLLSNEQYSDRARLVINEQASLDYEMSRDAAKMMSSDQTVPQLFINENGVRYAIDERPEGNGIYTLGAYFGQDGTYTLRLNATQTDGTQVMLTDTQTNMTTNLNVTDYTFTATAGTYNARFLIDLRLNTPTGANNFGACDKPIKRIENNHMVIITPDGKKYSVGGQRL